MRILACFLFLLSGPLSGQIHLQVKQRGFGNEHGLIMFLDQARIPLSEKGEMILDTVLSIPGPVSAMVVNKSSRYTEIWLDNGTNVVEVTKKGFPGSTEVKGSSTHALFKKIRYGDDQDIRQQLIEENANDPMVIQFVNKYHGLLDTTFLRHIYMTYSPEQQNKLPDVRAILFPIESPPMKVGSTMYDFIGTDRYGTSHDTRKSRGQFLLLDFAATGCGPCWAGYPDLIEISKEYDNLDLITFNEDDSKTVWERMAASRNLELDWPVLWETEKKVELFRLYEINGWPTFYLISPEGTILETWMGSNKSKLRSVLQQHIR